MGKNIDHKRERHVAGIRITSFVLGSFYLVSLLALIMFPMFSAPLAVKGAMLTMVGGLVVVAISLYFVNQRNYPIFLALTSLILFVTYLAYRFFTIINFQFQMDDESLFGGRGLDYQFLLPSIFIIISLLYLRFVVVLLINLVMLGFLTFELYGYFNSFEGLFFSSNFMEITSNYQAMNTNFFIANCQSTFFTSCVVLTVSFYIESLTNNVAKVERSNSQLGRYFSPEVREEIEKNSLTDSKMVETEQNVAVMFTDIEQFTKLSEGMTSTQVLSLISEYQSKMVAAIFQNGGTVDKFIGDSVMATFGTPTSRGNDCQNAINCARQMQVAMRQWEKERDERNLPIIRHRIGIHYGPCFVGNVGSEDRVEFTVIGDAVNVANRVCEACKDLDTSILITEDVKIRLSENIPTEVTQGFEIRGREEKINLHKLQI